jgi:hypothetical protein
MNYLKKIPLIVILFIEISCKNIEISTIRYKLKETDKVKFEFYGLKDTIMNGEKITHYIVDTFFPSKITNPNCSPRNELITSFDKSGTVSFYHKDSLKFVFQFTLQEGWQYKNGQIEQKNCFSYGMGMYLNELQYILK